MLEVSLPPSERTRISLLRLIGGGMSLPGLVSLAAVAEFLLFRMLQPLLRMAPTLLPGWLQGGLLSVGTFAAHFAGVLALCSLLALLFLAMRERGIASHPVGRLGLGMMALFFVGLAASEILLPRLLAETLGLVRAQWLMQTSSLCLAVLLTLAVVPRQTASGWHKLAMMMMLLPPLLLLENQWHLLTSRELMQRVSLVLILYGPTMSAAALGATGLLLLARRPWHWPTDSVALLLTSLIVSTMTMLLLIAPAAATRLIYVAFDLQLPHQRLAQGVYMGSLAVWSMSVFSLLFRHGALRLRGMGLLLVGLAGAQPRTIHQETFFLVGLLCMTESLLLDRERPSASSESWSKTA